MTQETELPASRIDEIVLRVVYDGDASIPYREDWTRGIGLPFARAIERAAVLAERERWRVALGACDAALSQCQPCAEPECGAEQREFIDVAREAAARLLCTPPAVMDDLVQRLHEEALRHDGCGEYHSAIRIREAADEIELLRAQLAERDRDVERLRAALVELVACKDLKDELTRLRSDPYYITQADIREAAYERRKPAAWGAARAAIDAARRDRNA